MSRLTISNYSRYSGSLILLRKIYLEQTSLIAVFDKCRLNIDQAGNVESWRAVGIVIFKLDLLDPTT